MRNLLLTGAAALTLAACATGSAEDPNVGCCPDLTTPPQAEASAVATPAPAEDPFLWLEEVQGKRALAWVAAQNAKSKAALEGDPRYQTFLNEALAIFTATDRIAAPGFRADGIDNFWQDKTHTRGLWRRTTLDSYSTASPKWESVLDMDALGKAEGRPWVWKGANCLDPDERLCLVALSDGGKDAVEVREFDTRSKSFVQGGFRIPEGKHRIDWVDENTLAVATEFAKGELTTSGYPFIVKLLKRGQTLDQATELYRGSAADGGYGVSPEALHDKDGKLQGVLIVRPTGTFDAEHYLSADGRSAPVRVPLPAKASYQTFVDGQLVFTLEEAWGGFQQGALIAYDLNALKRDTAAAKPVLIFQPNARQAVEGVTSTKNKLIVHLMEDVKGAVDVWDLQGGEWTVRRMDLPKNASINLGSASGSSDRLFVSVQGFLQPTSLWLADAEKGTAKQVKALPARFDASTQTVEQFWATSKDGTKIPYFLVRSKSVPMDGSTPVLVYGYGGFQVSKPPVYLPEVGKLWLERGGAYVIANIRGGGEFGPAWHQSVLRENRQKSFDDFAAVQEDLIARKISSSRRIGIYGRSNGGVLTTAVMTQRPELMNAVVVESPLVDMLRYHKLSAGASWTGEYGDPDNPADAAFIAKYSGYQNLREGVRYPKAYITTNTKDDRVHPGHARKYAAKLEAMGVPYLYFEDTEGGHSYDAAPTKNAERWARHYVYLSQQLMD